MKYQKIILLLPWAAALLGCQTSVVKPEDTLRVELGPHTSQYLQIRAVTEGHASSNLLRAGVNGFNTSSQAQQIRYRFIWIDSTGFEIASLPSRWQYTTLPPMEAFELNLVSSSPAAVDYRIRIYDQSRPAQTLSQGGYEK